MWLIFFIFCIFYWILYSPYRFILYNQDPIVHVTQNETSGVFDNSSSVDPNLSPRSVPFSHSIGFGVDGESSQPVVTIHSSHGGSWTLPTLTDSYAYDDRTSSISERDGCFGRPDGVKTKVRGETLYRYAHKKWNIRLDEQNQQTDPEASKTTFLNYVRHGFDFYFLCQQNRVQDVFACPPGTSFREGDCQPINVCTGQTDGRVFGDLLDRQFYRVCENEKPVRKSCPPETLFMVDSCRSIERDPSEICRHATATASSTTQSLVHDVLFPIDKTRYVRCILEKNDGDKPDQYRAVIERCPKGQAILASWNECFPDDCIGLPDDFKKPMSSQVQKRFSFSPGYYLCREDQVVETVYCPTEWNLLKSRGDNLTQLPSVFDSSRQACTLPSFCDNVFPEAPEDDIVPAHEFTKRVPEWKYSPIFDSVVGYRCKKGVKTRHVLEPGQRIVDNRIVSACEYDGAQRVPLGDRTDAYYDCHSESVVDCNQSSFFDGERCRSKLKNAHVYKSIPFFRLKGLSRRNNWMKPWEVAGPRTRTCSPGDVYLPPYDICSCPPCTLFPFLKQLPRKANVSWYSSDEKHACVYFPDEKQIKLKATHFGHKRLSFWSQKLLPANTDNRELNECQPGKKLQSGRFLLDSTIYVTCDPAQPFVFCPSSSTKGIARVSTAAGEGPFACQPEDSAFVAHIPAYETVTCLRQELRYAEIAIGAVYKVDGEENGGTELYGVHSIEPDKRIIEMRTNKESFTFWSDRPFVLHYSKVVTYPPNCYAEENGKLVSGTTDPKLGYWMRKEKEVDRPLLLPHHGEADILPMIPLT